MSMSIFLESTLVFVEPPAISATPFAVGVVFVAVVLSVSVSMYMQLGPIFMLGGRRGKKINMAAHALAV